MYDKNTEKEECEIKVNNGRKVAGGKGTETRVHKNVTRKSCRFRLLFTEVKPWHRRRGKGRR